MQGIGGDSHAGLNLKGAIRNPQSAMVVGTLLFALCLPAQAQQAKRVPRIGYLAVSPLSTFTQPTEAFRQGLRELGYAEGKTIFIEWRSAEGNSDRVPKLAAELVQFKADVIVTGGSRATHSAIAATVTIPIVMAQDPDPVANGFVAGLARPGGNITGLSLLSPELSGKRLELLKEIVPMLSRVAVFGTSTSAEDRKSLEEIKLAAGAMKVQLQYLNIVTGKDIDPGFRAAAKPRADVVLWTVSGSVSRAHRTQIVELAVKNRLPAIYNSAEWVEAGGLMSYGVSQRDLYRRAATYVDKILKGSQALGFAGGAAEKVRVRHLI
jgi:putative ABC transport system substrate-binding protein